MRLKLAWSAAGTLWTAAVQILVIPLYARLVPVEVYGVVLFTLAVRGNALALVQGFRVAFGRAVATTGRLDAAGPGLRRAFAGVGVAVSLGLLLLAPVTAERWLQVPEARTRDATFALAWLALSCAGVWWASSWEAVLWGRQRIGALAVVRVAVATLLGIGGAAVLHRWPDAAAPFCAFQAAVCGAHLLAARHLARRGGPAEVPHPEALPPGEATAARAGMTSDLVATVVLSSVATLTPQADRTLLGGLLPIGTYAAYGAAAAAGSGLLVTAVPVVETLYPVLVAAHARGAVDEAARVVLRGARWIALAAIPIVAVMSTESRVVLTLWLGPGALAAEGAPVLRWLALAFALVGFGSLTTTALVAAGASRSGLVIQVAHLALGCAALAASARAGGVAAAAAAWALAALAHCVVTLAALARVGRWGAATRRTLLRTAAMLLVAPAAALAAVRVVPALPDAGTVAQLLRLGAQGVAALLATALVTAVLFGRAPGGPLPAPAAAERS